MAEENKTEETTSPAPATSPVDEAGNPATSPTNPSGDFNGSQRTGVSMVQILAQLKDMLEDSGGYDADLMRAINGMMSYGAQLSAGGRNRNPSFGPFMASFVRPAGPEKTGIAKASPERMAEKAEERKEKREANRNRQARSIVALALEKGKGINAAMGQLKDRFGDSFANSWASSNGIQQDDNGQYRATEDVQDGIVRGAGRMTPEDKAARREQRLAKTEASRMKRMDKDGDGVISPEEEAADRAARDQRMKDRIRNLEQTDVNTGERFKPDINEDGVIDEKERAEQNRRIGNVEPTYTSPRDQRRNAAFEGVGLRAPRPGETSAMDVVRTDTQAAYEDKVDQINQEFLDKQADAAAVHERADTFEAMVPGTMEPSYIPGQALDVEAAMGDKLKELMPGVLDGSIDPKTAVQDLTNLRDAVIEQTDPTSADRDKILGQIMNFGPVPPDNNLPVDSIERLRQQGDGGLEPDFSEIGGGSFLPDQSKPVTPSFETQDSRTNVGMSADQLHRMQTDQALGDPPSMLGLDFDKSLLTYGMQQPDAIHKDSMVPDQDPDMAGYQGYPTQGRPVSPSNDFMQRFFGGQQQQFTAPPLNPSLMRQPDFYDAMGNPIYGTPYPTGSPTMGQFNY